MKLDDLIALNVLRFAKKDERINAMLKEFLERKEFIPNFTKEEYENAEKEINTAERIKVRIVPFYDDDFPKQLSVIKEPPLILYEKGTIKREDAVSVSIVGSRKCTEYGKSIARKLSSELARVGITIISGMAYGIDAESHRGALSSQGRTIAVLGCGVDVVYPTSNRVLYEQILENGAVVSEFPLGSKPVPYNFPIRNRIISGLSLATIVVEAQERSGSLITASYASEQGKDVFAVPGNITSESSKGTNALIRDGAIPLIETEDVLRNVRAFESLSIKNKVLISDEEKKILECLDNSSETLETLSQKLGMEPLKLLEQLTLMEINGIVKKSGGRFVKVI